MADTVWRVCGARKGLDERSEPHVRLLYDPNKVRGMSKATKRSALKPLLTIFIPFPLFNFSISINKYGENMENA